MRVSQHTAEASTKAILTKRGAGGLPKGACVLLKRIAMVKGHDLAVFPYWEYKLTMAAFRRILIPNWEHIYASFW